MLVWLVYSEVPLTVRHVLEALTINVDKQRIERKHARGLTELRSLCPDLISIDDNNPDPLSSRVSLIHFSVQEYLESPPQDSQEARTYYLERCLSHDHLAKACLVYLMQDDLKPSDPENFPLALYAANFWHSHLRAAESNEDPRTSLAFELFKSETLFTRMTKIGLPTTDSSSIHIYSYYSTPLIYASFYGLEDLVGVLLEEVSIRDTIETTNRIGDTALVCASWRGHLPVVKLLLEKDAEINAGKGRARGTPLGAANFERETIRGRTMVEMIGESAKNINAVTRLRAAELRQYEMVVRTLLQHGAKYSAIPPVEDVNRYCGSRSDFIVYEADGVDDGKKLILQGFGPLSLTTRIGNCLDRIHTICEEYFVIEIDLPPSFQEQWYELIEESGSKWVWKLASASVSIEEFGETPSAVLARLGTSSPPGDHTSTSQGRRTGNPNARQSQSSSSSGPGISRVGASNGCDSHASTGQGRRTRIPNARPSRESSSPGRGISRVGALNRYDSHASTGQGQPTGIPNARPSRDSSSPGRGTSSVGTSNLSGDHASTSQSQRTGLPNSRLSRDLSSLRRGTSNLSNSHASTSQGQRTGILNARPSRDSFSPRRGTSNLSGSHASTSQGQRTGIPNARPSRDSSSSGPVTTRSGPKKD